MWRVIYQAFIFLCLSGIAQADTLTCAKGGRHAMDAYQKAINLLSSGHRLSEDEERNVISLLKNAVSDKCSQAALALADIKANQMAANQGKDPSLIRLLDDETYGLLMEATKLNEGWYELGSYLLTTDSRHYDPKRAQEILEIAAKHGDKRAVEFLVHAYRDGIDGIHLNKERAEYWLQQLERK